jgi:hypothetical protein
MQGKILLGGALVAVLLTAGCGGAPRNDAGEVTAPASADAFQVKVGDCTGNLASGTVSDVGLIPCDQPHYYEAFASNQMTDTTYPGESATQEQADKFCGDTFETWMGISSDKSKYGVFYFYPTSSTWTMKDREILCFVGSSDGNIKGSLKGAKK